MYRDSGNVYDSSDPLLGIVSHVDVHICRHELTFVSSESRNFISASLGVATTMVKLLFKI